MCLRIGVAVLIGWLMSRIGAPDLRCGVVRNQCTASLPLPTLACEMPQATPSPRRDPTNLRAVHGWPSQLPGAPVATCGEVLIPRDHGEQDRRQQQHPVLWHA